MKKLSQHIFIIVLLLFSLTACQSKEPVTADVFQTTLEAQQYTVVDITDQYAGFEHILRALATEADGVHIEFFEINSKDNATAMFNNNQATVEAYKGSSSSSSSTSTSNYQRYSLTTSDTYYIIERVDTTMVYAYSDKAQKEALDGIFTELGY